MSEFIALQVEKPVSVVVAALPGASLSARAGLVDGCAGVPSAAPPSMSVTAGAPDIVHAADPVLVSEISANWWPLAPDPLSTSSRRLFVAQAGPDAGEFAVTTGLDAGADLDAGLVAVAAVALAVVADGSAVGVADGDGVCGERVTAVLAAGGGFVRAGFADVHAASASGPRARAARVRQWIRRMVS